MQTLYFQINCSCVNAERVSMLNDGSDSSVECASLERLFKVGV